MTESEATPPPQPPESELQFDVGSTDDGAADRIGDTVVVGRDPDQDRPNEMAADAGGAEHVPGAGCGDPEGHLAVPRSVRVGRKGKHSLVVMLRKIFCQR